MVAEDECARALPSDDSFADPDMGFCIEMTGGCADGVPDVRIVGLELGVSVFRVCSQADSQIHP